MEAQEAVCRAVYALHFARSGSDSSVPRSPHSLQAPTGQRVSALPLQSAGQGAVSSEGPKAEPREGKGRPG